MGWAARGGTSVSVAVARSRTPVSVGAVRRFAVTGDTNRTLSGPKFMDVRQPRQEERKPGTHDGAPDSEDLGLEM
jgi:hypothetical protein